MKQSKKNKHGLSRYIKTGIKEQIRRDAGFGCVFCGCILVEYEHIEPEFHNAKEHDPDKMTLLCPMCHDKVTKKIISKKKVWGAKNNPKALKDGFVSDTLLVATESLELLMGNVRTSMIAVAITLYGKPLFWFEPSEEDADYFTICCIFYGANGKAIAYINRNEYIALVGKQDIVSKGTLLSITDKINGVLLELSREGDQPLHIKRLYTQLYSTKVVITGENSPINFGDIDTPTDMLSAIGNGTLAGQGDNPNYIQTALSLAGISRKKFLSSIMTAIQISRVGEQILKFDGTCVAWRFGNLIINKSYNLVGMLTDGKAYTVTGEYVADLSNDQLLYPNDQYESGEPIFVIPNDRKSRNVRKYEGYDLSYRFAT